MSKTSTEPKSKYDEIFHNVYGVISEKILDSEKSIDNWVDFYNFLSSGIDLFLDKAAEDHNLLYMLMVRLLFNSYIEAKMSQPTVDFEIFKFMFVNNIDRYFKTTVNQLHRLERMPEDERNEYFKKHTDTET
jgi:hypothetical protein